MMKKHRPYTCIAKDFISLSPIYQLLLTLILLDSKVNSLWHQYTASPACKSVHPCTILYIILLIMGSSKNVRWITKYYLNFRPTFNHEKRIPCFQMTFREEKHVTEDRNTWSVAAAAIWNEVISFQHGDLRSAIIMALSGSLWWHSFRTSVAILSNSLWLNKKKYSMSHIFSFSLIN